jgi:hypothetical protein
MLCESWPRCLHDLKREAAGTIGRDRQNWLKYCPNAPTVEMLSMLQARTQAPPKYSVLRWPVLPR